MEKCDIPKCIKDLSKGQIAIIICVVIALIALATMLIKKSNEIILEGEIHTKEIEIFSRIPGTVEDITVEEGEEVQKNETIATILLEEKILSREELEIEENLRQAKIYEKKALIEKIEAQKNTIKDEGTRVQRAKDNYNYAKKMFETNKLSKEKYENSKNQLERAEENLKKANAKLLDYATFENGETDSGKDSAKYFEIKVPESGEISEIVIRKGDIVSTTNVIASVQVQNVMWAELRVSEELLSKFQDGKTFFAEIPALKKKKVRFMTTKITPIGKTASFETNKKTKGALLKTFEIKAVPLENKENIKTGMTIFVNWNKI